MEVLTFDIGDLPAFTAEQQHREMDRQAVVAVLDDGLLFLGISGVSSRILIR